MNLPFICTGTGSRNFSELTPYSWDTIWSRNFDLYSHESCSRFFGNDEDIIQDFALSFYSLTIPQLFTKFSTSLQNFPLFSKFTFLQLVLSFQ